MDGLKVANWIEVRSPIEIFANCFIVIHNDIGLKKFVIPGLTRIQSFSEFLLEFVPMEIEAEMTYVVAINDAVLSRQTVFSPL